MQRVHSQSLADFGIMSARLRRSQLMCGAGEIFLPALRTRCMNSCLAVVSRAPAVLTSGRVRAHAPSQKPAINAAVMSNGAQNHAGNVASPLTVGAADWLLPAVPLTGEDPASSVTMAVNVSTSHQAMVMRGR